MININDFIVHFLCILKLTKISSTDILIKRQTLLQINGTTIISPYCGELWVLVNYRLIFKTTVCQKTSRCGGASSLKLLMKQKDFKDILSKALTVDDKKLNLILLDSQLFKNWRVIRIKDKHKSLPKSWVIMHKEKTRLLEEIMRFSWQKN